MSDLISRSQKSHVPPTLLAAFYFVLEEKDVGFQWLKRACEEYDSWVRLLKTDTIFDSVREDPRYLEILRKIGLER